MSEDPGAVWRSQPGEKVSVELEQILARRAGVLDASTRAEILTSLAAALLLAGVVAWRMAPVGDRSLEIGFGAILAWVALSVYFFRRRLRRPGGPEALAEPSLGYYRRQLASRRAHLKSAWLWHGPLLLACVLLAAILAGKAYPGGGRLMSVAPLFAVLILWTGYGIYRRYQQAREIEREMAELDELVK